MAVKLLMTWNILSGREQEYFEFMVRDFVPGMQRLGMEASDAWYTMYGDHPQILAVTLMPSLDDFQKLIVSTEWKDLTGRLLDYVENFEYKVVQARSGFQM